jgi:hypothetical protein
LETTLKSFEVHKPLEEVRERTSGRLHHNGWSGDVMPGTALSRVVFRRVKELRLRVAVEAAEDEMASNESEAALPILLARLTKGDKSGGVRVVDDMVHDVGVGEVVDNDDTCDVSESPACCSLYVLVLTDSPPSGAGACGWWAGLSMVGSAEWKDLR